MRHDPIPPTSSITPTADALERVDQLPHVELKPVTFIAASGDIDALGDPHNGRRFWPIYTPSGQE